MPGIGSSRSTAQRPAAPASRNECPDGAGPATSPRRRPAGSARPRTSRSVPIMPRPNQTPCPASRCALSLRAAFAPTEAANLRPSSVAFPTQACLKLGETTEEAAFQFRGDLFARFARLSVRVRNSASPPAGAGRDPSRRLHGARRPARRRRSSPTRLHRPRDRPRDRPASRRSKFRAQAPQRSRADGAGARRSRRGSRRRSARRRSSPAKISERQEDLKIHGHRSGRLVAFGGWLLCASPIAPIMYSALSGIVLELVV